MSITVVYPQEREITPDVEPIGSARQNALPAGEASKGIADIFLNTGIPYKGAHGGYHNVRPNPVDRFGW